MKAVKVWYLSSKVFSLFLILFGIGFLTNCVNIKSDYTQPKLYTLVQQPLDAQIISDLSTDFIIFIKEFDINSSLETSKIAIFEDGVSIKYYNYNQWTSPLNEILTEYSINRISQYGIFKAGIASSIYSSTPDLVLECKVLSCAINNYTDVNKPNNIELIISVTLQKSEKNKLEFTPIFFKTYNKSLQYNDSQLETTVKTLSILMSNMIDLWLIDIFDNI